MSDQPIIQTIEVTKIYGTDGIQVTALDGVSLDIQAGEFLAVMGPSGSGKSTLMNIIGCLDRPTSGQYILSGQDVSNLSKNDLAAIRNQRIGFVFQSYNLLARTSALENVMLPLLYNRNDGSSEAEQRQRALAALDQVGLTDRALHQPQELSGGQRQRVAIARALINQPDIILADEPTGNLDSRAGQEVMAIFAGLHTQGITIMMVTHEDEIAAYAQRVIHFRDGRISQDRRNGRRLHPDEQPLPLEEAFHEPG
jgi:putative ABC transport system ATP-binding protein